MYPSETAACHSAPYDPFWTFWTWYARGTWLSWEPQTISFFGLGSWDKYLGHTCEKRKSSHSSAVRFLYCLANFSRAAHCLAVSRGFFYVLSGLQPLLFINLQMVFFPPSWPLLANCCESCLVEFPLLYLAFAQNCFSCLIKDFRSSRSFLVFKPVISWQPFHYPKFRFFQLFGNFFNWQASRSKYRCWAF